MAKIHNMSSTTIVNEQDEVIGYKSRDEILPTYIYRVSALWITNSKGEILLAQRALSKKNDPGRWGPAVAGTVEEGETYDSNIVKEAGEELGLKNIHPIKGPKVRVAQKHQYWLQWYSLVLDALVGSFVIEPKEVMAIQWFTPEELGGKLENEITSFIASAVEWKKLFL
jgi:isopentenyl-diphosphate delta-isomerase